MGRHRFAAIAVMMARHRRLLFLLFVGVCIGAVVIGTHEGTNTLGHAK